MVLGWFVANCTFRSDNLNKLTDISRMDMPYVNHETAVLTENVKLPDQTAKDHWSDHN